MIASVASLFPFFFNDTATTEIYTLSLHDALPICLFPIIFGGGQAKISLVFPEGSQDILEAGVEILAQPPGKKVVNIGDRKSTRLNSSHANISYAVFCLKKKKYNKYLICVSCIRIK